MSDSRLFTVMGRHVISRIRDALRRIVRLGGNRAVRTWTLCFCDDCIVSNCNFAFLDVFDAVLEMIGRLFVDLMAQLTNSLDFGVRVLLIDFSP